MSETTAVTPDKLTVMLLDDQPLTLLMTFGLLNRLTSYIGELNNIPNIYLQPDLQDVIIYEVLVKRDNEGVAYQKYETHKMANKVSPDEAEKILNWCEGHVSNFFMKRLRSAKAAQDRMIQQMKA